MNARLQGLPFDPTALQGSSPALISSHNQNDYGGAVKRPQAIRAQLAQAAFPAAPAFHLYGLKRQELIASNSVLLHGLYLGSLGGDGALMDRAGVVQPN